MRRVIFSMLSAFALLLTVSAVAGMGSAQAQASDDDLIPVCVEDFETPVFVDYLTQAQIDETEAAYEARDRAEPPPTRIVGYPDPATESCATENGVPKPYDPATNTLICVPSGPERDGPLVPLLGINKYLPRTDLILADPVTGACPQEEATDDGTEASDPPSFEPTSICYAKWTGHGPDTDTPSDTWFYISQAEASQRALSYFHEVQRESGGVEFGLSAEECAQLEPLADTTDDGTYDLLILVRNCDDEPADPFGPEQEGCAPGVGAFFNVYADGGAFLGNCEAESTDPSTSTFASCFVEVPYGSTGIVVEDLASIPNFLPGVNPVSFTAPDSGSVAVGEVTDGPVFINVRQDGSIPTDLPNTGAGPASTGADSMPLVTVLSAVAALLGVMGLRTRRQP